jgi:hypothetical protein
MASAEYELTAAALDERDMALLVALAEHKILSTYQLKILFFDSLRTAQKRMKELRDLHLLSAFSWRSRRTNRESERHVLSARGAQLVCGNLGLQRTQLGWIPADAADAKKRLWHLSGANAFFCELIEATLHTDDFGLLNWRPEHQIRTKDGWIQPDGFGRLLHPGGISEFFFEFDRATENRTPLIAKFARYLRVGTSWVDSESFPSVLVLVPDEDREATLRRLLAEATGTVEPEQAVITARFYSSNLDPLKRLGHLDDVWRPILGGGTSRAPMTGLPAVEPARQSQGQPVGRHFGNALDAAGAEVGRAHETSHRNGGDGRCSS